MTSVPQWKVGLELELLAPPGSSRKSFADEIARACGGSVKRIFYQQSEFALVDEATVFENLTLGFAIENKNGELIAKCVDDLTLIDDLDPSQGPIPGWYRILSDDLRFLSLIEGHCDASADQLTVLEPLANLFDVNIETVNDEPLTRVSDYRGTSIAMAATLPGERHRPCELITAPLTAGRDETVRHFLTLAHELSFTVPVEAAIHIHFDGKPLKSAAVISNLITIFGHYRSALRQLIGTNPKNRRLGDWPKGIYRLISSENFSALDWPEARAKLREAEPIKFCDFNIANLLVDNKEKDTFEVRIIPGSMDADFILRSTRLFEAMLKTCLTNNKGKNQPLPDLMDYLANIGLSNEDLQFWQAEWQNKTKKSNFGFLNALKKLKD